MATYTHKNLGAVKDSASDYGFGEVGEGRYANEDLATEQTGLSHLKLHPGKRVEFGHKHAKAEEVYVVIAGSGRIKLDDDIIDIVELDAIRVSPEVVRSFEAGPEGISLLAVGARHGHDGEVIEDWWTD
jgi:mannose-6-phosphate isomerase-like protein (cupin superfamily)